MKRLESMGIHRPRTSTIVLTVLFLAVLVLYYLVRPASAPVGTTQPAPGLTYTSTPAPSYSSPAPAASSPSPSHTEQPSHSATPSATPSPSETSSPSPSPVSVAPDPPASP